MRKSVYSSTFYLLYGIAKIIFEPSEKSTRNADIQGGRKKRYLKTQQSLKIPPLSVLACTTRKQRIFWDRHGVFFAVESCLHWRIYPTNAAAAVPMPFWEQGAVADIPLATIIFLSKTSARTRKIFCRPKLPFSCRKKFIAQKPYSRAEKSVCRSFYAVSMRAVFRSPLRLLCVSAQALFRLAGTDICGTVIICKGRQSRVDSFFRQ